jgi:hypothetical protein
MQNVRREPGGLLRPRFVHERSLRSSVGQRPAEVHLDVDDLLIPNREDLGVPESTAVSVASLVGSFTMPLAAMDQESTTD